MGSSPTLPPRRETKARLEVLSEVVRCARLERASVSVAAHQCPTHVVHCRHELELHNMVGIARVSVVEGSV